MVKIKIWMIKEKKTLFIRKFNFLMKKIWLIKKEQLEKNGLAKDLEDEREKNIIH